MKKTRPRRPQTNAKIERFHRILLEEWADVRPWPSDRQRAVGYDGFIHYSNQLRAHGALGWSTPAAILNTLRDNLSGDRTLDVLHSTAVSVQSASLFELSL